MIANNLDFTTDKTYTAIYDPAPMVTVIVRVDPYRKLLKPMVRNPVDYKEVNDPAYNQIGRTKKKGGRKRW